MGKRGYLACVAYDPEQVQGTFGNTTPHPMAGGGGANTERAGFGKLSLAADFMVQAAESSAAVPGGGGGGIGGVIKYGPVVVPCLEYGR